MVAIRRFRHHKRIYSDWSYLVQKYSKRQHRKNRELTGALREDGQNQDHNTYVNMGDDSSASSHSTVHWMLTGSFPSSYGSILRACLAETLGVLVFVLVVSVSVSVAAMIDRGGHVAQAAACGLTFSALLAATSKVSGGHLNPAVTLAAVMAGRLHPGMSAAYLVAQLNGAVLGSVLTLGVLGLERFTLVWGGASALSADVSCMQGVLAEMLFTAVFVAVVLYKMSKDAAGRTSTMATLSVGFAVAMGVLAGAHSRGASMNPARSFGPAAVMTCIDMSVWRDHWVFWAGPLLGAALAVVLYRINQFMKLEPESPSQATDRPAARMCGVDPTDQVEVDLDDGCKPSVHYTRMY